MTVRNPSEFTRLEEERQELKTQLKNYMFRDKTTKETLLRQIREIEAILGIEGIPYNSNDF